jgi:hypothetical protein
MRFLNFLSSGFSFAARAKKLVLIFWLLPLVPALMLGVMASASMMPELGRSLFASRALSGDPYFVFLQFRTSFGDLIPIFGTGLLLMAAATLLMQVLVSSGVVEVALERETKNPFVSGVRRNFLSFLRTTGLSLVATALALTLAGLVARGFTKLAESRGDGTLDLVGVAVAAVIFWILWAPADLAADLSRIAAARHDQRSMTRGFLRSLSAVWKRPVTFVPLALCFVLLPFAVHAVYTALRSPWSPSSMTSILMLIVAQQALMIVRATLKVGFWGATVAAYRHLGEPELCRRREKRRRETMSEEEAPPADYGPASA